MELRGRTRGRSSGWLPRNSHASKATIGLLIAASTLEPWTAPVTGNVITANSTSEKQNYANTPRCIRQTTTLSLLRQQSDHLIRVFHTTACHSFPDSHHCSSAKWPVPQIHPGCTLGILSRSGTIAALSNVRGSHRSSRPQVPSHLCQRGEHETVLQLPLVQLTLQRHQQSLSRHPTPARHVEYTSCGPARMSKWSLIRTRPSMAPCVPFLRLSCCCC